MTAGFQADGRIHTFAVQPDGRLSEGPGSPFVAREISGTVGYSWSADGRRLFVSNFRGSAVTVFSVDATTAALEPVGPAYPNGGGAACWTALSPDGTTLYTGNFVGNSISAFTIRLRWDTVTPRHGPASRHDGARHQGHRESRPMASIYYAIGPIGRHVAVFAIGADRLPRELPAGQSPYRVMSGQWTTGLVVK